MTAAAEAAGRWEALIADEVGDALTARVIRLLGDGIASTPSLGSLSPSTTLRSLSIGWHTSPSPGLNTGGVATAGRHRRPGSARLVEPATVAAVTLVLLLAQHRPVLSTVAVTAGAYLTVLGVGLVLFFSAGQQPKQSMAWWSPSVSWRSGSRFSLIVEGFDGSATGLERGYAYLTGSHQRPPSGSGLA